MTAAWMAYALLVGALVALAAHALDAVCRLVARPTRWVWAVAMLLTVSLIALAPQRVPQTAMKTRVMHVVGTVASVEAPRQSLVERFTATLLGARDAVGGTVEHGLAFAASLAPAPLEHGLALFWVGLSALALLLVLAVHGRFQRARRSWPVAELHGARVRLAPDAGPAVVGVAHPEIVVPRWLLRRSDAEQRLVIAHEVEHLRARDPLLLTCAWVAAALVAWHPAVWWMLSRLRLAVELDCDERIMRSGVTPNSYGALLIELAGRCSSGMRIGAPALADGSSHLKRRLLAMTPRRPKFARAIAGALAACSVVLFALACDAKLPTSDEVNSMDVSAAEGAAKRLAIFGVNDSLVTFTIDGRQATAREAHALAPGEIATIEVMKKKIDESAGSGTESGQVRIITKRAADSLGIVGMREPADGSPRAVTIVRRDTVGGGKGEVGVRFKTLMADTVVFHATGPNDAATVKREPFNGVLLLNGVRVDNKALTEIPPDQIASIEVTKGAAARKLYADSAAANGVISIKTRSASPERH